MLNDASIQKEIGVKGLVKEDYRKTRFGRFINKPKKTFLIVNLN